MIWHRIGSVFFLIRRKKQFKHLVTNLSSEILNTTFLRLLLIIASPERCLEIDFHLCKPWSCFLPVYFGNKVSCTSGWRLISVEGGNWQRIVGQVAMRMWEAHVCRCRLRPDFVMPASIACCVYCTLKQLKGALLASICSEGTCKDRMLVKKKCAQVFVRYNISIVVGSCLRNVLSVASQELMIWYLLKRWWYDITSSQLDVHINRGLISVKCKLNIDFRI